jgi:hypothetical protein
MVLLLALLRAAAAVPAARGRGRRRRARTCSVHCSMQRYGRARRRAGGPHQAAAAGKTELNARLTSPAPRRGARRPQPGARRDRTALRPPRAHLPRPRRLRRRPVVDLELLRRLVHAAGRRAGAGPGWARAPRRRVRATAARRRGPRARALGARAQPPHLKSTRYTGRGMLAAGRRCGRGGGRRVGSGAAAALLLPGRLGRGSWCSRDQIDSKARKVRFAGRNGGSLPSRVAQVVSTPAAARLLAASCASPAPGASTRA